MATTKFAVVEPSADGMPRDINNRDQNGRWAVTRTIRRLVSEHETPDNILIEVHAELSRVIKEGRVPLRIALDAVQLLQDDLFEERAKRTVSWSESQQDLFSLDD